MIAEMTLAMACGFGQIHSLDARGNSICTQTETGEVRSMQGSVDHCPTGMVPMLTTGGSACVDKDTSKAYYQMKGLCPNGSYPALDNYGNRVCKQ